MGFGYQTATAAIVTVLSNANTTTASPDLSNGLTTRFKTIKAIDPEIVDLRGDLYPALFVRLSRKQEEFGGLGPTGGAGRARKFCTVSYDVIALYRKDGANSPHSSLTAEVMKMAANVESVLQKDYTLSGTALWCQPVGTDFLGPWGDGNIWVKGVGIELEARYGFQ